MNKLFGVIIDEVSEYVLLSNLYPIPDCRMTLLITLNCLLDLLHRCSELLIDSYYLCLPPFDLLHAYQLC